MFVFRGVQILCKVGQHQHPRQNDIPDLCHLSGPELRRLQTCQCFFFPGQSFWKWFHFTMKTPYEFVGGGSYDLTHSHVSI